MRGHRKRQEGKERGKVGREAEKGERGEELTSD